MSYYLAPSLAQLRAEVNARWPGRSKRSDGWIGDRAHRNRKSDHNPNSRGSVNAFDFTVQGIDKAALIAAAKRHPSVQYIISDRKIMNRDIGNFRARHYSGANPHTAHVHISIRQNRSAEQDTRSWGIATASAPKPAPKPTPKPAPKEKGILGMTGYEQYSRTGDQTIPAKSKARIRMHQASKAHAGPHYIAQPKRKGQQFLLGADVSIYRVPAGADVKAQIVVAIRDSKGKWEIKRPFPQVSFPAGANGWSAVHLSQAEQFGYGIPKGGRAEYQVEISNYSSKPVRVVRTRSASFYE